MPKTDQAIYTALADSYKMTKREGMLSILHCGRILNEAKEQLPHGMFSTFLDDIRVTESDRTAQRLMSIFKNYRHLLDNGSKRLDNITQLGLSHLLELQKLPDRFKKDIEIVHEDGKHETVNVIDEEKLNDFLEQKVDVGDKRMAMKDLSLHEMKKYIKEAQGVYEPDVDYEDNSETVPEQAVHPDIKKSKDKVKELIEHISMIVTASTEVMNDIQGIDYSDLMAESDGLKDQLKLKLKQCISSAEGLIVRCTDLKEKMQG
jgi:hypothetical protein